VDIAKSIEIMKLLADISRLHVLIFLMDKPQYVEELTYMLNLAVSTVSFHLKKMISQDL
jgi:DNA-binding transcriptional ArsR family regulator